MNHKWNSKEKLKLIELYSKGKSYDDIAKEFNLNTNSIKLRLESIIYDNIVKNKSIDALSKTLNTNDETILQMYYSYKNFKEKKIEKNNSSKIKNNIFAHKNNDCENKNIIASQEYHNIENENKILEAIIKNSMMKNKIKYLYENKKLDINALKLYDKYFNQYTNNN